MTRHEIIERIGSQYHTANIEGGEYSYIKEAVANAMSILTSVKYKPSG